MERTQLAGKQALCRLLVRLLQPFGGGRLQQVGDPEAHAVYEHHGGIRRAPLQGVRQVQRRLQGTPVPGPAPLVDLDSPAHLLVARLRRRDQQHRPAHVQGQLLGQVALTAASAAQHQHKTLSHPSAPIR